MRAAAHRPQGAVAAAHTGLDWRNTWTAGEAPSVFGDRCHGQHGEKDAPGISGASGAGSAPSTSAAFTQYEQVAPAMHATNLVPGGAPPKAKA